MLQEESSGLFNTKHERRIAKPALTGGTSLSSTNHGTHGHRRKKPKEKRRREEGGKKKKRKRTEFSRGTLSKKVESVSSTTSAFTTTKQATATRARSGKIETRLISAIP
jgi:hypothetical protein